MGQIWFSKLVHGPKILGYCVIKLVQNWSMGQKNWSGDHFWDTKLVHKIDEKWVKKVIFWLKMAIFGCFSGVFR